MPLPEIASWWVSTPLADVLADGNYLEAVLAGPNDWSTYEMWHSAPPVNPQNYVDLPLTRPDVSDQPRIHRRLAGGVGGFADSGGANLAVARMHYLNEDRLVTAAVDEAHTWGDNGLIGYFVADFEHAGPHSMLEEALAVANGNARFIAHLTGNTFNRGFPYVRTPLLCRVSFHFPLSQARYWPAQPANPGWWCDASKPPVTAPGLQW